jgi:thioredoxin 1
MPALNLDTDSDRIAERVNDSDTLLVACLCAEWCGTCRDYHAEFDRLADSHPEMCFVWIDIETHADRFEDLDVENFPTLLIEDDVTTRFFGTVLPHISIAERLLSELTPLSDAVGAPKLRPSLALA